MPKANYRATKPAPHVSATASYPPSEQQQAVIDACLSPAAGNLNIIARAGAGKTSVLKMLVERLADQPSNQHGIFLCAFNKAIAEEIKAWLEGSGIPWNKAGAGTMHSIGYKAWAKIAPFACKNIEGKKTWKILDEMFPPVGTTLANGEITATDHPSRVYNSFVFKAVSLAKQRAFGVLGSIDDRKLWFDLVDHFGLEEDLDEALSVEHGIEICIPVYKRSLELCKQVIDFDDMILAPLYFKAKFWQYSWVLIDEAQDTNPARRALALAILAPGGKLVAVGDPAQAIYGFTGADHDSMDLIKTALNSKELPLNRTYRCPKAVVKLANTWVSDLQATDAAPEGIVREMRIGAFWLAVQGKELRSSDAILCRNVAPMVEMAYGLLRRGVACKVEGREIGQGLVKLANRFNVKLLPTLVDQLREWQAKETQKWLAKGKENKAAEIEDRCETIAVLADALIEQGKTRVEDLVAFINGMFADSGDGQQRQLVLSTIHKSKGREWDRVFLLGRNVLMPSKWARKGWQLQQEDNLAYVAVTRAKKELVEVMMEKKEKRA